MASVNSALQRARARVADAGATSKLPSRHVATADELGLVERYARAFEQGDVSSLVRLLRDDITMTMPPDPAWFRGRDDVARFLERWVFSARGPMRVVRSDANRQPGLALYERRDDGRWQGLSLQVLACDGHAIAEITGFVGTEMFAHFGLEAMSLRADSSHQHGGGKRWERG